MFQSKVLATAVAALVASSRVIEAEKREDRTHERSENKTEFVFQDCELEEEPHLWNGAKGVIKLRQNEDGDYEVEGDDDSEKDQEGLYSITIDEDPFCSFNNFIGQSLQIGSLGLSGDLGADLLYRYAGEIG